MPGGGQGGVVAAPRRGEQIVGDRLGDQLVTEPDAALAPGSDGQLVGGLDQEAVLDPLCDAGRNIRVQAVALTRVAR